MVPLDVPKNSPYKTPTSSMPTSTITRAPGKFTTTPPVPKSGNKRMANSPISLPAGNEMGEFAMRLLPDFGTGGVVVNLPGARVIVLVGIEEVGVL